MTDHTKIAEDARRLLRGFHAVETLAKAFEEVGTLEQTIKDNRNSVAAARADLALVQNDVSNQRVALDMLRSEAKRTTADAKTVAEGIVDSANAKAQATLQGAEATALAVKGIAQEAVAAAESAASVALEQRDALLAEVADLEKRAENARKYLAKLAAQETP